ncbi:carbohydrate ABC transporter permease [Paenibacillus guangzhouensis]|uniref:carbohydrate ABC transporter permease n=1 Tax=Paenibacillus guangzhouensis TaxID=1473112 RepID=UPI0012673533|nr:carbohydrate ABC transporter permease [Paenibacillus guangzhouensis]
MKANLSDKISVAFMYMIIVLFAAFFIYPLLIVLGVSFTDEKQVVAEGYAILPKHFSLDAYKYIFTSLGDKVMSGYLVTIFVTVVGTAACMVVTTTYAYAASVRGFKHRNVLNVLAYIPLVFNAGILPWYILLTKYYHLTNSLFALFVPALMNLFYVFLLRNFFSTVPPEIAEAAKIDGAGHISILFHIYIPVARVGMVTIALFYALSFWNDFYLAMMFMTNQQLYPLQFYLYTVLSNIDFLSNNQGTAMASAIKVPLQTTKMALTCITVGPIILVYPFLQRFFVKGVVIGAVKG